MEQIVRESKDITEFQRRVYLELLRTKMGETLSYSELATRLGYLRSSAICRAIGQALKRNPWSYGWQQANNADSVTETATDSSAILINPTLLTTCVPCHRVIRSNGTIGGYCGETKGAKLALKQALLDAERDARTE